MAKLNVKTVTDIRTHEGAPARRIDAEAQLRRSVLSCFLWEKEFYEDGKDISKRIIEYAMAVPPAVLADIAVEARQKFNLRHVPLLLLSVLCKTGRGTDLTNTFDCVIQRADELAEFVSVYAVVNGVTSDKVKKKLSAQAKKGLALAFRKFDAYQLAKYNRDGQVKLRDVLFLSHAKPDNDEQAALWKKLVDGTLESPDTWEVQLSAGADKKETFERLLREEKLGYLALLRNLRNMNDVGVDRDLVKATILDRRGADRVLPFRFVAAARYAPTYERELDAALIASIKLMDKLPGKTVVLVDVSGSMDWKLSAKSDMNRIDAAAALASIIPAEDLRVFTFSNEIVEVPPRQGMAGVDAITRSQRHAGTRLGAAMKEINAGVDYDRVIVITDEQSQDSVPNPKQGSRGYMINVASYENGVGYGPWVHIDGFSEGVLRYIHEYERNTSH